MSTKAVSLPPQSLSRRAEPVPPEFIAAFRDLLTVPGAADLFLSYTREAEQVGGAR